MRSWLASGTSIRFSVSYSTMEYQGISRSFAVDYVVLGFLAEQPLHGYELRDRLSDGLGALWRIASSQLYNVLRRLEKKAWVEREDVPQDNSPPRKVYHLTEAGHAAFWGWAVSPVRHLRDVRVEFLAKLYLVRRLAPERIPELVDAEITALRQLAEHIERRSMIQSDDDVFGELAIGFRRSQVEGTLAWLIEHAEEMQRMEES